jgi:PAS domain S-box-containing protein
MINKLLEYLNPISRLGKKRYSTLFPLLIVLFAAVILEVYAFAIAKNAEIVGVPAIVGGIALIIYFAFRDGLRGGFISSGMVVLYYFYITFSRKYTGQRLTTSLETIGILGGLYFAMGGIIGWLKKTIDSLIEREANERKRLRTIVEQLPVGIVITDRDGEVVLTNKKVSSILGIDVPIGFNAGSGVLINTVHKGLPLQPGQSPLARVLKSEQPVISDELMFSKGDGKKVYIQNSAAVIKSDDGDVIAAASIINDVTQQKLLEERKDDFINMASHELKTPITSMKLYLDSLKKYLEKSSDERSLKTLGSIRNQTDRLQRIVNDLLDVSRLQTGKLTFNMEEFQLDRLIEEAIESLQPNSKNQNIQFAQKSPLSIHGDKFRIYQALTNIITNAIKYSAENTDIIVKMENLGEIVQISVQDFGIGIGEEEQSKIFDRLYQVNDDKEKTFPGFGMGLYISKEIIKRHNGEISVKSVKDQGSTFYITLPVTLN